MDEDQFVAYMNSVDDMKQTSEICMFVFMNRNSNSG